MKTLHTRLLHTLLTGAVLLMIAGLPARAMTDTYIVFETTGTPTDMSKSTEIFGPGTGESASDLIKIGFDFVLDGETYSEFSVSQAGLMSLGVRTESDDEDTHYFPNNENITDHRPMIAAYWGEDLEPSDEGGKVHYKVTGSAPNRVLTVEWYDLQEFGESSRHYGTYQIRLYETLNRIEFWYGRMKGSSSSSDEASIGIGVSDERYIHVLGNTIPADIVVYPEDRTGTDYFLTKEPISENTLYVFQPCLETLFITGNPNEGGTLKMTDGDEILSSKQVMRGSVDTFYPFTLENTDIACGPISYAITFSGEHAGDYSASGTTLRVGQSTTPGITFRPNGHGTRTATMTITTSEEQVMTYTVAAEGLTRIDWIGVESDGGVPNLPEGADLMRSIEQPRSTAENYTPILIDNMNTDPTSTSTTITYRLNDPYGTYAISLDGNGSPRQGTQVLRDVIGPDGSSLPVITFHPHPDGFERGTGPQPATLSVEVDGISRTFDLRAFGIDRALELYADGERVLHGERRLFRSQTSCVGDRVMTVEIRLENVNREDVTIEEIEFLATENEIRQGTPRYPLKLDMVGNPVPSIDYFFTDNPGIAPVPVNRKTDFPITLEPGEARTIYLNYVGQLPGRRFGRLFFRTDAVNLIDTDVEGYLPTSDGSEEQQEGLFTIDLIARSVGAELATDPDGGLERLTLDFPQVRIGQSAMTATTIYNSGDCDLVIAKRAVQIAAGDAEEFEIVEMFPGVPTDGDGNWVLAPGAGGDIAARFTPRGLGSRVATLKLPTNDSTLIHPGVTHRGVYSVDLFGTGLADLVVEDVELEPTVIDGDPSDGRLLLENVTGELVRISEIRIVGPAYESGEIIPVSWPGFPLVLNPLSETALMLDFIPASGSEPGLREATVEVELESGEVIEVKVVGRAGTRTLEAPTTTLFSGTTVAPGETARSMAIVTNTGTFPVEISDIRIEGPGADDYSFIAPRRSIVAPGGFEFIEVTYAPTAAGSSAAELIVESNSTEGSLMVTLSAEAAGIGGIADPSGSASEASTGGQAEGTLRSGISSVATGATGSTTLTISAVRPNPTAGGAEIDVAAAAGAEMRIDLYDLTGTHLGRIYEGEATETGRTIAIDLGSVPEGYYFLRITSGETIEHRTLRLVR